MSTGVSMPYPKIGGHFSTMAVGTAFFAGVVGTFYWSRFWSHSKDDQTWIVRHGQQPSSAHGWIQHDMSGPRLVHTSTFVEPPNLLARVPLRGNTDNRGSDSVLGHVMSFVAGKGIFPDGLSPANPTNKQVPVMQRQNQAGTHFYTKNLPFDVKAWNAAHPTPARA